MQHTRIKRMDRGIPLGTVGEFEMLGLKLPANIPNRNQLHESNVIMIPGSSATRVVLDLFDQWRIPVRSQPRVLRVSGKILSR